MAREESIREKLKEETDAFYCEVVVVAVVVVVVVVVVAVVVVGSSGGGGGSLVEVGLIVSCSCSSAIFCEVRKYVRKYVSAVVSTYVK